MYNKIKSYFTVGNFSLIVMDSFSHEKLGSFLNKFGIDFSGVRMASVSKEELSMALGEESYIHPEIMEKLIEYLNKANQDIIGTIKSKTLQEIRNYLGDIESRYLERKVGNILWALLCDDRKDVNGLINGFMSSVLKFHKRFVRRGKRISKEVRKETRLEEIIAKEIQNYVQHLEEEASCNQKVLQGLQEESKSLNNKVDKMQERIHELHKLNGQLMNDKGILKKGNERLQTHIEDLKREIVQLKEKLQTAPKARLASEVHHLERENKKLLYELEKERGENKDQMQRYTLENKELRERLNELQIMTYRLEEELGMEKQRVDSLEQKKDIQTTSPSGEIPLHKGKRLGIFVDGQNVYYSARLHYGGRIDYKKLISMLIRDRHLVKAVCYIIEQPDVDQEKFINMLRYSGYAVKTRSLIKRGDGSLKANWDVGIAAEVMNAIDKNSLDIVCLVTCDGDFVDLLKLLKPKGVRVEVAGFPYNTAMELKSVADEFYSIEEDLMLVS